MVCVSFAGCGLILKSQPVVAAVVAVTLQLSAEQKPESRRRTRTVPDRCKKKKRRNGVKAVRGAARATGQTRRAAAGGLSVFFACHESQRKTRVFDAVPTEV